MKKYSLRYLPIAQNDLLDIVDYITNVLNNRIAAENTLSKIEKAILERLESPESFAVWQSNKSREYPYRRINFENHFALHKSPRFNGRRPHNPLVKRRKNNNGKPANALPSL